MIDVGPWYVGALLFLIGWAINFDTRKREP